MIPGSHKGPLYSHFEDGAFVSGITDPAFDDSSAVHIEVPSGGASFHHPLTVHGSSANLAIKTFTAHVVFQLQRSRFMAPDCCGWTRVHESWSGGLGKVLLHGC